MGVGWLGLCQALNNLRLPAGGTLTAKGRRILRCSACMMYQRGAAACMVSHIFSAKAGLEVLSLIDNCI